jgi:hypothetical protein
MSTSDIKYKYALSKSGEAVCIDSLTEKDRDDYECLGCGNILRPVLPKKRQKHFRHKSQQACSTETYLHRMGKKLFIKQYSECLTLNNPYIIELETPVFCNSCQYGQCSDSKKIFLDLTEQFNSIKEEKRDGNLTPDILLENKSGEKIYVEIDVTHPSSEGKISSGNKIIEFKIKTEDDLEIFKRGKVDISIDKIKVYNFYLQPEEIQLQNSCPKFFLHRRGKELFVEKYNNCLTFNNPYTIEFEVPVYCNSCQYGPCPRCPQKERYDLTSNFRLIKAEQVDQYLIPDIIIETKSGEKIYIEIAVAHFFSKKSKNRIIEYIIQQHEDLKVFKENNISIFDEKIKIYNFNPKAKEISLKKLCDKTIDYFTVFPSGKCKILTCPLHKWDAIKGSKKYIVEVELSDSEVFIQETEKAFYAGIKVRNCFLCRYHARNKFYSLFKESNPIFCKFYKEQKKSNFAANCEIYRPDKKVFRYT